MKSFQRCRRSPGVQLAVLLSALLYYAHAVANSSLQSDDMMSTVKALEGKSNKERVDTALGLLREAGFEPVQQRFKEKQGERTFRGRNLITQLGQSSASPRIVIGAHVDAIEFSDGSISRGAIDNAGGAAIVMHLARRLRDQRLNHPIDIVLFDREEDGLLGSRYYVRQAKPGDIAAAINLDIGMSGRTIMFGPESGAGNEAMYDLSERVCARRKTDCLSFPQYPPSDDRSFQSAKIPNISFAIVPAVQAHQMWLLLNGGSESGLQHNFAPAILRQIHTDNDSSDHMEEEALQILLGHIEAYVIALDAELQN